MTKHTPVENTEAMSLVGSARHGRVRKGPRGYGAMRDVQLNIDPRIDLTKPIYEQVLALQKADKEAAEAVAEK